jgi:hypothetical protein
LLQRTKRSQLWAPEHVTSHCCIAPQPTLRHARVLVHAMSHRGAPHCTPSPRHELAPLHSIVQLSAAPQRTPLAQLPSPWQRTAHVGPSHLTAALQLPVPVQLTSHGTSAGHAGQSAPVQVITQVPAMQLPGQSELSHRPGAASSRAASIRAASSGGDPSRGFKPVKEQPAATRRIRARMVSSYQPGHWNSMTSTLPSR